MAKNAIVIRNKSSSYYHASRPLHCLLADGTAAGITGALKKSGAGSTLIAGFGPDGGSAVANWKTAPWGAGPARNTLYSGYSVAIGSVTGWAIIETPHCWRLLVETTGPVASANSFKFGEIIVAHDSTIGESATYGNADGRTIYGMMSGVQLWTVGVTGSEALVGGQSTGFIAAEATVRTIASARDAISNDFTSTYMVPSGYGTGDWVSAADMIACISGSFRIGSPSYEQNCKQGAYYSTLTVGGQVCRRLGNSASTAHIVTTPYRKPGASADTLVFSRTVATYATWTDFLQAVWDYFASGTYWEQDSSA